MRTQLGAVDGGTVGHERVWLELRLRPLDHDIAGQGGARGLDAAAVPDELSAHFAPWTWTCAHDGKGSARSRTRDGVADRWLLYSQESPSAAGARGLARGQVFQDGSVVVSVVQEGLIRSTPKPS